MEAMLAQGGGGLNMVRLQCPHKALAAHAPRLSSPSIQRPLSGGMAAIGQVWNLHFRSNRACPTAFLA